MDRTSELEAAAERCLEARAWLEAAGDSTLLAIMDALLLQLGLQLAESLKRRA